MNLQYAWELSGNAFTQVPSDLVLLVSIMLMLETTLAALTFPSPSQFDTDHTCETPLSWVPLDEILTLILPLIINSFGNSSSLDN